MFFKQYKTLEEMVREVKTESSNLASASPNVDKTEKRSMRTRRSSSPFRCMMGGLVQQKTLVKDQELSTAMLRIQELEELLVSRQKEVENQTLIYIIHFSFGEVCRLINDYANYLRKSNSLIHYIILTLMRNKELKNYLYIFYAII